MSHITRSSGRINRYLGPIAGQENTEDTFLRVEHKIDPNVFSGPTGTRCVIPIHDPVSLDGELTHPCVVYTPEKWNGYYYWMAVTPYKDSIDSYEDPNIVASNDGLNWEVPAGLTNPLDDAPGGTRYNSDTHLVFGPNNVLYLFWRQLDISGGSPGAEEKMYVRTSTDGIAWTPKQLVHQTDQTVQRLLSPSFEYYEGKWHMFAVDIVGTKRVVYTTNTTLDPNAWAPAIDCTVTLPVGRYPWHLFVARVGDQWVGLLNDSSNVGNSGQDGDLILMTSDIGNETSWDVATQACVPRAGTGFTRQYRSCFVPKVVNGMWGLDLWHSVWNPKYIYRTALTSLDYRPQSNGQYNKIGIGGPAGTRRLRLTDVAPEMEFVESDNTDKTWHIGVNSGIWKVTETGVRDKLLIQSADQAYSLRFTDTNAGSSGIWEAVQLNLTANHTGTRGWTGWYLNMLDSSGGSGTKLLARLSVNSATKFSVDNSGNISTAVGSRASFSAQTGSSSITRNIVLQALDDYSRAWITSLDKNGRNQASVGWHGINSSDGKTHNAWEIKTSVDPNATDPTVLQTRFFVQSDKDLPDVGMNYIGNLFVYKSDGSNQKVFNVDASNGQIQIGTATPPATSTSTGTKGQVAYDDNYIYMCTATNTWRRIPLQSW